MKIQKRNVVLVRGRCLFLYAAQPHFRSLL